MRVNDIINYYYIKSILLETEAPRLNSDWKDYEIIDASDGEKLERWGDYILIRPDPQIIWKTPRKNPLWKQADGVYERSSKGGGAWTRSRLPESWNIHYGNFVFNIKPMGFKHTGLFPEQADNWDFILREIRGSGRKIKLLNLFAYTGAASVAALAAGAEVCHVDASKGMVAWAKENVKSSGLEHEKIRYIVDDCMKFVQREIRRGNRYDAVVLDPPSYGRGPGGEVWKLEESIFEFLTAVKNVLSEEPLFVILNSYTSGLSAKTMETVLKAAFMPEFAGECESEELLLDIKDSGLKLACGSTARFRPERK